MPLNETTTPVAPMPTQKIAPVAQIHMPLNETATPAAQTPAQKISPVLQIPVTSYETALPTVPNANISTAIVPVDGPPDSPSLPQALTHIPQQID